ncbi:MULTISPECIES: TIGR03752 family integrating conjugative element protein [Pseudomonadota]|uniref:TIGR03752 family integrating conjugative element protein n=1 Tax=Pigmentiphaga daeguensis TaxID=414049 RepID=A0ABN1C8Y8_9BURK
MRSNGLLKWLMIPVALLVLFIGVRLFSGGGASTPSQADAGSQLTPEEMKALGIEGDTPRDTVATLVAQVKQLRTELQTALSDNKSQREENQRLRQRENSIDQRINSALESERSNLRRDQQQAASERQQTEGLLADLQRRLESIGGRGGGHADLPVGLGLRDGDETGMEGGVRWVEPDDAKKAEDRGSSSGAMSFPTSFGPAQRTLETTAQTVANAGARAAGVKTAKAVYTVPTNSTLMGSVAMTALIGRVPIDGTVNDPYPFKVLVGPDNLTANGIDIPDVAGAVFSGTASGDWTLSCVRGQVRSITFVFHDGTIRTIPEDRDGNQQNNQQQNSQSGGLGWISDPYGIPCVSGERRSNAQQYLGSQALITAAGAGVASLIESDSGQMSYVGSDGSIGTVGISGQEAVGRILASGVQDMSNWVNKLYGQAFAAVYVQPGAKVALHLEKPLALDFDPEGRKVDHRAGESHALELD